MLEGEDYWNNGITSSKNGWGENKTKQNKTNLTQTKNR